MSMTIGQLAQRLGITARAVRHYEQLGLLRPAYIDADNGYRTYGVAELVRGMRIEQFKATGLTLATIASLLGGQADTEQALIERRRRIEAISAEHTRQLATIDALVASGSRLADPEVVECPPTNAVVMRGTCRHDQLDRTIRRMLQQVGRSVRCRDGVRCRSFSARFPLGTDGCEIDLEVAGHVDEPVTGSIVQPAETRLTVLVIGGIGLLPLAYDIALMTARERGLRTSGSVVEHYLDLSVAGRTEVALPFTSDDHASPAADIRRAGVSAHFVASVGP